MPAHTGKLNNPSPWRRGVSTIPERDTEFLGMCRKSDGVR
jgi:hypothetical protein